jgi:hypothetical protein
VGFRPWAIGDSVADGDGGFDDDYDDDDAYVELILVREPDIAAPPRASVHENTSGSERVVHPRPAPVRNGVSIRPLRGTLDHPPAPAEPVRLARNGSSVGGRVDNYGRHSSGG